MEHAYLSVFDDFDTHLLEQLSYGESNKMKICSIA